MAKGIAVDTWSYNEISAEKSRMETHAKEKGFEPRVVSMGQALHSRLAKLKKLEDAIQNGNLQWLESSTSKEEENIKEISVL